MSDPQPPRSDERLRLEERLARLAEEKANLQLVNELMSRLSALHGLENVVQGMLQGIIETIGGTNVLLYYWVDGKLRRADLSGNPVDLSALDDPEVEQVMASGQALEVPRDGTESLTRGSALRTSWNWLLPLSVGGELIGVLKLENLQFGIGMMGPFLHNFFNYAAAVLKNEILGETQLKHAYEELKQVNASLAVAVDASQAANRAKSAFLANMSHELRTPLNAILGFAQLLERDLALDDQQGQRLLAIQRGGEHLLELINDILELSRIEAGRLTSHVGSFDPRRLVGSVVDLMEVRAAAKHLTIISDFSASLPVRVLGDEAHLRQVLLNLLSNAVKYSDQGQIWLRLVWDGALAHFEVIDCGLGIREEDQQRVFDPFYQTTVGVARGDGTGLGLAISRDFVRLMGGELQLESSPGYGSRFFFAIPLGTFVEEQGETDTSRTRADIPAQGYETAIEEAELDAVVLARLAPEPLAKLRYGAEILNGDIVREATEAISVSDPKLARSLSKLADDYQFDRILEALDGPRTQRPLSS